MSTSLDFFGGAGSLAPVIDALVTALEAETEAIGTIKPWISESDIPDGWHHFGAQDANEFDNGRLYKYSEYPEFCEFINKSRGYPLQNDVSLEVLRFGETFRQTIKYDKDGTHDVTRVWDWQPDAIRNITGYVNGRSSTTDATLFSKGGGALFGTHERSTVQIDSTKLVDGISGDRCLTIELDASKSVPTAKDNRMTNRSVNFIIKVKHSQAYYALMQLAGKVNK